MPVGIRSRGTLHSAYPMHPEAIERYLDVVQNLAASPSRRIVGGDEQIATALREILETVIVRKMRPAGQGPFSLSLKPNSAPHNGRSVNLFP
jgi:hypothetical protein